MQYLDEIIRQDYPLTALNKISGYFLRPKNSGDKRAIAQVTLEVETTSY